MAQLETRLSRVEHAFDTNTEVFSDGIKMLEVQQQVIFRILQDVFNGRVRVKGVISNDDGIPRATVDVDSYIREHLEEMQKREEAPPPPPEAETRPVLADVDDNSPVVFGGDGA